MTPREKKMVQLFRRVLREKDTYNDQMTARAQAMGFVAWVFDVHPQTVARAVRVTEEQEAATA